jgi:hypothetical protein
MNKLKEQLRELKTLRGKKSIDEAIINGCKLIQRKVEPYRAVRGKYCIVKDKKLGTEEKIFDFRDGRYFSEEYEIVKDWTYIYYHYDFPPEAAYVIPNDIMEGEIVLIIDLIENLPGFDYNQGGSDRLKKCKAVWENNDLIIQYNPKVDCKTIIG